MQRFLRSRALVLAAAVVSLGAQSHPATAAAAKANSACSKVGQKTTVAGVALTCTKTGTKNLWRVQATAVATTVATAVATTVATTVQATAMPVSTRPPAPDAFQNVIDAANKEGKVLLYSSQPVDVLAPFAALFKSTYPNIDLQYIRMTDAELTPKLEAERITGKYIADMFVANSQAWIEPKGRDEVNWFSGPVGPNFQANGYLPEYIWKGGYFEVGGAVLAFGWNTKAYPQGLKEYGDLLDPKLSGGKIGILDANCCSAAVDFYLHIEDKFGPDFLAKLAAQKPRFYGSAVPIGEALASGEIVASGFNLPLFTQKANGAPVEFGVGASPWGTRYFGGILQEAKHPNAAQVLANFMVSPAAQTILAKGVSSVLPTIPGAITNNSKLRKQDLSQLTPGKVTAYQAKWNAMFR